DPLPFRTFAAKCRRDPDAHGTSELVFLSLVENVVNLLADVLDSLAPQLDALSEEVFEDEGAARGASDLGGARPPPEERGRGRPPRTDLQAVVARLRRGHARARTLGGSPRTV